MVKSVNLHIFSADARQTQMSLIFLLVIFSMVVFGLSRRVLGAVFTSPPVCVEVITTCSARSPSRSLGGQRSVYGFCWLLWRLYSNRVSAGSEVSCWRPLQSSHLQLNAVLLSPAAPWWQVYVSADLFLTPRLAVVSGSCSLIGQPAGHLSTPGRWKTWQSAEDRGSLNASHFSDVSNKLLSSVRTSPLCLMSDWACVYWAFCVYLSLSAGWLLRKLSCCSRRQTLKAR